MPLDSVGVDVKMSAVDLEPKTYSPMSGSDENMSSPPSVLTTASAGSCTPSAGSTPSSVQSAGSTPYQFGSHEESTVIKPLTPSDNQSVHSFTPDQPVTPEPNTLSDIATPYVISNDSSTKKCSSPEATPEPMSLCHVENTNNICDEMNERREGCPCIICIDKTSFSSVIDKTCSFSPVIDKAKEEVNLNNSLDSNSSSVKRESPKVVKGKSDSFKHRRRSHKKNVHYQSELSQDPESTSIKIKIKLTSSPSKHRKKAVALSPYTFASSLPECTLPCVKSKDKSPNASVKRKKSQSTTDGVGLSRGQPSSVKKKRSRAKVIENFTHWGPIESTVNGEEQSKWGYCIPREVLENIFLFATYSEGCLPILLRMAKVCRLWREVSIMPKLWHSIDLSSSMIKSRFRNDKKLLWITENRLLHVRDLNLAGWSDAVTPLMLRRISEFCTKLENLNVANCTKLHAENLYSLLYSSVNLHSLDLTGIVGAHKPSPRCAVGQQTISELASFLNDKFRSLILANNTLSNIQSIISSLAEHCKNLQVLDLSSLVTIGLYDVKLDIEKLQKGCSKIRVLRLANSPFRLTQSSMSEQVSSPGFPELEELSLAVNDRFNAGMNDSELERILKNSNKLCLLDVRRCRNITDSSLVRIPPWDLEHLFLSGGSTPKPYSDRLELVIRKWQHSLVELDLSWTCNEEAIDSALVALSEDQNERLELLNLCGSSVSFVPVREVLKNCLKLRWLNLSSCRALPRGVKRLHETIDDVEKLRKSIEEGKFDEVSYE